MNRPGRYTDLSRGMIAVLLACMIIMDGCASKDVHSAAASYQAPQRGPETLAVWMPWFGDHKHMDVGYSSQDTARNAAADQGSSQPGHLRVCCRLVWRTAAIS